MPHYVVTGATGFIGKRLLRALLARRGSVVHVLLRPSSADKLPALLDFCGLKGSARARVRVLPGDLTLPRLGVPPAALAALKAERPIVFHLGAVYDLAADAQSQQRVNVEGTRQLLAFARAVAARHLHHLSSIAAAGQYEGLFREDMFEQARGLDHPYFATKHASEKLVRAERRVPWTVWRPSFVVGDSRTGEMDKIDGPYHFFKPIQRLRQWLPPWMPAIGLEGGRINVVPVDYVVRVIDHLAHAGRPLAGRTFHVVDPQGHRLGDLLDLLARAAHAPKIGLFVNAALLGFIPRSVRQGLLALAPVQRIRKAILQDLGMPEEVLRYLNWPTRYDRSQLDETLAGSGIECPRLEDYAWRLWDHWERHLDPDLFIDRTLAGAVRGKVVVVTGGSSGIGLAAAHRFAAAGATTVICGRDPVKLDEACAEAVARGHRFTAYAVDLADMADCDRFVRLLEQNHGGVDFLVNNAGRSIRRAIENSTDRFHDFERTMQLNYFGCLRVTLGLLPGMSERRAGHVVNISSIGVLTNAPRFSAYVASKAALDAWTRCAASEYADRGVTFTTIHMPLVRTPMIAPTKVYDNVPTLSPDEAAEMIAQACITRPVRIATRLGTFGELVHALMPRVAQLIMNTAFRMFPDSEAARGKGTPAAGAEGRSAARPRLSAEALALQQLMRGIHF